MANPKKRTSTRKRDQRRSHHALTSANLVSCSNCGDLKMRHRVCPSCGHYKNREVVAVQLD